MYPKLCPVPPTGTYILLWSSTLASESLRRRNLFKTRCVCWGTVGTPLSTTRFSSRGASIILEVSKIICSAGTRSCHKQSRHLLRRSGAEVSCCTTQGARRHGGLGPSTRGQKGKSRSDHIRYRAHATLQLGRLRAGQSQITVAMLWYACHGFAWVCTEVNASPALGAFVFIRCVA